MGKKYKVDIGFKNGVEKEYMFTCDSDIKMIDIFEQIGVKNAGKLKFKDLRSNRFVFANLEDITFARIDGLEVED